MSKKISLNRLLILVNIIFFGVIGILFFMLNRNPQTPVAVIAPHIQMETITLKVGNVDSMRQFYAQLLGMEIVSQGQNKVTLGFHNHPILVLLQTPQLRMPSQSDPGLDQIAIVFNSRPGLARAIQRILRLNPSLYLGGTGRGVIGEAFYVSDPQGNTLEVYYDTDPSTWPRTAKGNVEGDAQPIDVGNYINQYAMQQGDNGMKLGHVQMRIGNIVQGKSFYLDTVGFYAIPSLLGDGQSLFMSDGFYHHDLVINQAQGFDGDSITNYQGLYGFSFSVPRKSYINNLEKRLTQAHIAFTLGINSITFHDPWGIVISVDVVSQSFWDVVTARI